MMTSNLEQYFRPSPQRIQWYRGASVVDINDGFSDDSPMSMTHRVHREPSPEHLNAKIIKRGTVSKTTSTVVFGIDSNSFRTSNAMKHPQVVYPRESLPRVTDSRVALAPNSTVPHKRNEVPEYLSSTKRAYDRATSYSYVPKTRNAWYRGRSQVPICGPRTFPHQDFSPSRSQGGGATQDLSQSWPALPPTSASSPREPLDATARSEAALLELTPRTHKQEAFKPFARADSPPRTVRGGQSKTVSRVHECIRDDPSPDRLPRFEGRSTTHREHDGRAGVRASHQKAAWQSTVSFTPINQLEAAKAKLRAMGKL